MNFTTEQQSFLEESLTFIEVNGKLVLGSLRTGIWPGLIFMAVSIGSIM